LYLQFEHWEFIINNIKLLGIIDNTKLLGLKAQRKTLMGPSPYHRVINLSYQFKSEPQQFFLKSNDIF